MTKSRFLFHFSWTTLALYGGMFAYVAVRQILYPGFTEPQEGDILQHIERITQGVPLYPKPGGEFIALAHMPLYYLMAAPFYLLFGDSFVGPRLLSALCAVASGGLIGCITWRESGSRVMAYVAGALYFSSYRIMDAYAASAMPDSLMLFWLLLGLYFFAYGTRRLHDILWLLCFSLAFWTKQHGALYFGFAVFYALFFRRNYLPRWAIVLGILLGGPIAYAIGGTFLGEGFFFHTYTVPGRWEHRLVYSVRRAGFILACAVPFAGLLSLVYLKYSSRLRRMCPTPLGWFALTAFLSASVTMMAAGSSNNHYIPFMAALSATAALGLQALTASGKPPAIAGWLTGMALLSTTVTMVARRTYSHHDISLMPLLAAITILGGYVVVTSRGKLSQAVRPVMVGTLLVAGQFAVAFYYPPHYLPESGYRAGIARLRSEIARLDGPVIWAPYGNVPVALTGSKIARAPSWVALQDVERQINAGKEPERHLAAFRAYIRGIRNLYVLSDSPIAELPVWQSLAADLILIRDFGHDLAAVRNIAKRWYGSRSYPRYLYRQRQAVMAEYHRAQPVD